MASLSFRWVACGSDIKLAPWRFRLEAAGMKGWRERAADIFTKQREIAAKMKSAPGPVPSDFPAGPRKRRVGRVLGALPMDGSGLLEVHKRHECRAALSPKRHEKRERVIGERNGNGLL